MVKPLLRGHLFSGHPLFSAQLSESRKICQSFTVKKTSSERPPLLSGHLLIPRGWPLNCGLTVVTSFASLHLKGWRSVESARHMRVEFVVGSPLAPRGFSQGTPVSPSSQKPTFLNSNSIRNPRATGLSVARLLDVTLVKHSRSCAG